MKKILVAMSGGVDSAVAALLLKKQDFNVSGAYMKNWINEENIFGECPWEQDIKDAQAVADIIGINFEVINFIKDYRSLVVNYLIDGYSKGITPNPDVICNREIKFGIFLNYAIENGYDGIATGHYCRKQINEMGNFEICEGRDQNKDQSYFLALLSQKQLRYSYFPIGDMTKPQVRDFAIKYNLPNAQKKDSQGICFIGKVKMADFLDKFIPKKPGDIISDDGRVLGKHNGIHLYTIGQRKGIGIPSNSNDEYYVVKAKDINNNRLIVTFDKPGTPDLYGQEYVLKNLSYVNEPIVQSVNILAKPRYRDPSQEICFTPLSNNEAKIKFTKPQRALAAGQVCALYNKNILLGGGVYL